MSDWSLPRSTSSLMGDWIAAARAHATATTDEQRAAVLVRVESLAARDRAGERMTELDAGMAVMAETFTRWLEQIRPAVEEVCRRLADAARHLQADPVEQRGARPHLVIADETITAPIAGRAHRSTGPPLPPLDPRRRRK
jgi:hypothetical protein